MATYKVIQDIEVEDKLVGPLSLRQFIYGGVAALCAYLSFVAVAKGFAFFLVVLIPPMLFTGFFAFPWGRDQPTEVWALAKIRFFLKPRRRIWDQSGMKDLVNITVPKKIERTYTKGLTQIEVKSRLTALANTIDSRGWAVKNVSANLSSPYVQPAVDDSDRLISVSSLPQEVTTTDITPSDDMLDEANNPVAQQLDQLVTASSGAHRQRIVEQLQQPGNPGPSGAIPQLPPPADYWFLNQPTAPPKPSGNNAVFTDSQVVLPGTDDVTSAITTTEPTEDERALAKRLKAQREKAQQTINYQHLKVIQPLGMAPPPTAVPVPPPAANTTQQQTPPPPVTPPPDPARIELAKRDDLNIATIARIANKKDEPPEEPDEVVISLHNHAS